VPVAVVVVVTEAFLHGHKLRKNIGGTVRNDICNVLRYIVLDTMDDS